MPKTVKCNLICPACNKKMTEMREHHYKELAVFKCSNCGYCQTVSNDGEYIPQEELNHYYNTYIKNN